MIIYLICVTTGLQILLICQNLIKNNQCLTSDRRILINSTKNVVVMEQSAII